MPSLHYLLCKSCYAFCAEEKDERKGKKKKGGKNRSIRGYGIIGNDQGLGEPEWGGRTMKMTQLSARVYKEFDFRRGNSSIDPCPFRVCERESR